MVSTLPMEARYRFPAKPGPLVGSLRVRLATGKTTPLPCLPSNVLDVAPTFFTFCFSCLPSSFVFASSRDTPTCDADCTLGAAVTATNCTSACGTLTQSITAAATGTGTCTQGTYVCQPADGACPANAACSTITCAAGWTADSTATATTCASTTCDSAGSDNALCCNENAASSPSPSSQSSSPSPAATTPTDGSPSPTTQLSSPSPAATLTGDIDGSNSIHAMVLNGVVVVAALALLH